MVAAYSKPARIMRKCKPKECKVCGTIFPPFNSLTKVCSTKCALELVEKKNEQILNRAIKSQQKVIRQARRERKEKLKRRQDWIKDLQVVFNKFIRLRDKDDPCISCGKYDHEINDYLVGGKWDCGHYLSVGAHPELRFTEFNANKQCKSDNAGAGKFAHKNNTVTQNYRINLIAKIGQKNVDILEGPHKPLKLDINQIKTLIAVYKLKIKQLQVE